MNAAPPPSEADPSPRATDARLQLVLFGVALALRALHLFHLRDAEVAAVLVGDGAAYDAWAEQLRAHGLGTEVFYQAPLYPCFLAAVYAVFGHHVFAARAVQAVLGAFGCVLLARAGAARFGRGAGLLAGGLLAVFPPAIFFDGLLHKASLDLFCASLLLLCLARAEDARARGVRWALAAGAALGALALTRETALILVPLLAAWMAWRLSPRAALTFVAGAALLLAPVALRNRAVGGELVLTSSQAGANFFIGNNADADGTYVPLRWGHADIASEHADAVELAQAAAGRALTAAEVSRYWSDRAWAWIRANPADWLRLTARKALLLVSAREISDSDDYAAYQDASPVLWLGARVFSFGLLAPLAAVGLALSWRRLRQLESLLVILVGLAGATALFFVFGRYRAALIPGLALLAAMGLVEGWGRLRARRFRGLAPAAAAFVAVAIVGHLPLVDEAPPGAMAYYNLGVAREAAGEPEAAATDYRRALQADATFVQAHVNLGSLLARQGGDHLPEAIAEEREALRLRPGDALAHLNLANALFEKASLDQAELHYRAALHADAGLEPARAGLEAVAEARARR